MFSKALNLTELLEGLRGDFRQKVDIIGIVESANLIFAGCYRLVRIHSILQAVSEDEMLGQGEAPWLHGVSLAKVHVLNLAVVVERDLVASRTGNLHLFYASHDGLVSLLVAPPSFVIFGDRWTGRGPFRIDAVVPIGPVAMSGGVVVLVICRGVGA